MVQQGLGRRPFRDARLEATGGHLWSHELAAVTRAQQDTSKAKHVCCLAHYREPESTNLKNSVYKAEVSTGHGTSTHQRLQDAGARGSHAGATGGKQALAGLPGSRGDRHIDERPYCPWRASWGDGKHTKYWAHCHRCAP